MNLFKSRCAAFVIDTFVITFLASFLSHFLPAFDKAVYTLYLISFSCKDLLFHGSSLGKKIMKLSVVDISGQPAKISKLVLRNIPTYLLVWLEFLQIKRGQPRIGDMLAETMVVHI